MLELTKKQKKTARILIDKGLKKEFEAGILNFESIIQSWRKTNTDHQETYYKLYKTLADFDQKLSLRYDNMKGSTYLFILAAQLQMASLP